MQYYDEYQLVFDGKFVIRQSKSRHRLYTERAVYSSWFSRIVKLIKSTGIDINKAKYD